MDNEAEGPTGQAMVLIQQEHCEYFDKMLQNYSPTSIPFSFAYVEHTTPYCVCNWSVALL